VRHPDWQVGLLGSFPKASRRIDRQRAADAQTFWLLRTPIAPCRSRAAASTFRPRLKRLLTGPTRDAPMQSNPGSLDNQITVCGCVDLLTSRKIKEGEKGGRYRGGIQSADPA